MKPLEEFYKYDFVWRSRTESSIQAVIDNKVANGRLFHGGNLAIKIFDGPPLLMGDSLAYEWLIANYLRTTNFMEGRAPAMGEISAIFSNRSENPTSISIDLSGFRYIQEVFSQLRKIEDIYLTEFEMPLQRQKVDGAVLKDIFQKFISCDEMIDFSVMLGKHYNNERFVCYPRLENDAWIIATPPFASIGIYSDDKGQGGFRDLHSHPVNLSWYDSLASANDFGSMINCNMGSTDYGCYDLLTNYESYTMNLPAEILFRINDDGEIFRCQDNPKRKLDMLKKKRDLFGKAVECDMLGIRSKWFPELNAIKISPIVSESHYKSVAGSVPEGINLGLDRLYFCNRSERKNYIDFQKL